MSHSFHEGPANRTIQLQHAEELLNSKCNCKNPIALKSGLYCGYCNPEQSTFCQQQRTQVSIRQFRARRKGRTSDSMELLESNKNFELRNLNILNKIKVYSSEQSIHFIIKTILAARKTILAPKGPPDHYIASAARHRPSRYSPMIMIATVPRPRCPSGLTSKSARRWRSL